MTWCKITALNKYNSLILRYIWLQKEANKFISKVEFSRGLLFNRNNHRTNSNELRYRNLKLEYFLLPKNLFTSISNFLNLNFLSVLLEFHPPS